MEQFFYDSLQLTFDSIFWNIIMKHLPKSAKVFKKYHRWTNGVGNSQSDK